MFNNRSASFAGVWNNRTNKVVSRGRQELCYYAWWRISTLVWQYQDIFGRRKVGWSSLWLKWIMNQRKLYETPSSAFIYPCPLVWNLALNWAISRFFFFFKQKTAQKRTKRRAACMRIKRNNRGLRMLVTMFRTPEWRAQSLPEFQIQHFDSSATLSQHIFNFSFYWSLLKSVSTVAVITGCSPILRNIN